MMKRKVFFILIFLFIFSCFHSAIGEYRKETVIVEFFEAPLCENDRSLFSVDSYAFIQKEQAHFLSVAEEELNRKIEPIYTYSHVMNGMALNLYPDEMKEIKNHPLVKSVREEKIYKELRAPSNAEMMCGTEYVWASGYEGEGMVIAIIDSECDTDHSMFTLSDESTAVISYADIEQKLSSLNLLSKKLMPQVTAADIYKSAKIPYAFNYGTASSDCNNPISTHGTHVTGIAAANNKNAYANGVDGVAPEAQLYILSCMNANGELPEHTLLAALEDAVLLEADVINCSWGIEGGVTNDSFFSKIINRINQNGVIVCCAAGNEGKAAKNNSYGKQTILASYTDFGTLSTPAAATGALSVGACSTAFTPDSASLAYFSSWGTSSALEIKPEILAPGNAIYSTQSENLYGTMSGTSMATPFMSGACALMLQHVKKEYPTFSPFQRAQLVKQLLASSAVLLKSEGNYVSPRGQGAGVVQIANALTSPTVLYGEDGEPHLELGDNLKDSFTFSFYAENITEQELTFTVKGCVLNDEASYAGTVKDYVVTNTAPFPEASMLLEGTQINENHIDYKARIITLLPKEKKKITISVALEEILCMQKQMVFKNGFFIEGFVIFDNPQCSVSIPYLGYIGDWTKAKLFDRIKYEDGKGFFGDSYLLYPYRDSFYIMGEGIYEVTEKGTSDYIAISPNGDGAGDYIGIKLILLRAAKNLHFSVENKKGELQWKQDYGSAVKTIHKDTCLTTVLWEGNDLNDQIAQEGEYVLKVKGEKDYIGTYSTEAFSVPIVVDTTAPRLSSLDIQEIEGTTYLVIKAFDNHYLQLAQISENQYVQTKDPIKNGENTLYLPIDGMENGTKATVTLMDYALNQTAFTFTPANGYCACYKDGRLVYVKAYRAVLENQNVWNSPVIPENIEYDKKENFLWKSMLLPLL